MRPPHFSCSLSFHRYDPLIEAAQAGMEVIVRVVMANGTACVCTDFEVVEHE